jgi:hypothetical protein
MANVTKIFARYRDDAGPYRTISLDNGLDVCGCLRAIVIVPHPFRFAMNSNADTSGDFRERLRQVRSRIEAAAKRSDRSVEEITLVAVSKTHPANIVRATIDAGVTDLGENRVQEADS